MFVAGATLVLRAKQHHLRGECSSKEAQLCEPCALDIILQAVCGRILQDMHVGFWPAARVRIASLGALAPWLIQTVVTLFFRSR
mmetsp:Transcript_86077/g.157738  ORF Transcript_86077/g.157738 Transcript_86077/m.157738 type:complete len:84 (-) Transcript_86077:1099-1350(-)